MKSLRAREHLLRIASERGELLVARIRLALTTFLLVIPLTSLFTFLTPRERAVLERIAEGLDNSEIASVLGLAEKTVRNHVSNIFTKLQVVDRAQAIIRAREAGLR